MEYAGYTTAISGKRQEMDSELVCPTPCILPPYLITSLILLHVIIAIGYSYSYRPYTEPTKK